MPVFYFQHHSPSHTMRDDIGCDFASLELAYLDAYRSMIEIGAELLKMQEDPSGHRIDITDHGGHLLMDLSFSEVFQKRRPPRRGVERGALKAKLQRFRELRGEIEDVCLSARASMATAHELLRRARTAG